LKQPRINGGPGAGGYELKREDGTSAAEQLARLVPKGCIATAFMSISSALIRDPARGEKPTVFTCADDEAARSAFRGVLMWRRELFDDDLRM
jgi:predicted dinucleotide-binding enzyme